MLKPNIKKIIVNLAFKIKKIINKLKIINYNKIKLK